VQALRERYAHKTPLRVFYEIWHQPLTTIGGTQILSDVIRLCGGRNVFARLNALAPQVSEEAVLASRPEVIIGSGVADERPAWLDAWRRWSQLPAVKNNQLLHIHPDLVLRATPRLVDGATELCELLDAARMRMVSQKRLKDDEFSGQ